MSTRPFILLVDDGRRGSDALAPQLVRLGVEPIRVDDLAEAVEIAKSKAYSLRGVLIPSHFSGGEIKRTLKSIRRREPMLPAMAWGKPPDAAGRRALQKSDVLLALWDGFDDGILRFQLNRLISGDGHGPVRNSRRAPTHVPVRVLVGGREKSGVLYSVSETGCFVESPRASMEHARLQLVFQLEERGYSIDGVVAFANVPGNLQRPNLPLGMGVRFEGVPDATRRELADYIRARLDLLEV